MFYVLPRFKYILCPRTNTHLWNLYILFSSCSLVGLPAVVSLAVPVAIIILANAVSFLKIALRLRESPNISCSRKTYPGQQLLREMSILVLLGITWVLGFLTLGNATLTFQYLFAIFNSFQGFLIFVLYCLVPKKMRTKYMEFFKCIKNDNLLPKDTRNTLSMKTLWKTESENEILTSRAFNFGPCNDISNHRIVFQN